MIDIWERQGKNQKKVQLMKKEKEALEKLCIEFEVPLSQPIWQDALDRELYLDYELLQRSREAKNLAQETLCREICTQETLSRIERAKGKARADTFRRLAEELGRRGERCSTCIDTERYEILKLERQIGRYCRYEKFEEAKAAFEKLASYDLKDSKENLQYLTFEAALFDLLLGKTTHKEAILKYQEALDMTLSREEQKNLKNSFLTRQEATILNSIAICHFRLSERDKAVSLLKTLQENLRQSNVDFRYHTRIVFPIWGNLASYLEETKDYAGSLEICRQAICLAFQTGQADVFQRFVTTKGCVLEDQERREESIECFIQAYYLSCLFADEKKVQLLKGHLESKYSIFLDE
jgi:tetratricopeptide (TPR) repeat protein